MMKNKKCEIVRDLLPSYLDKLTSKESNEMIEEHLRTCSLCKERINNMSGELKIDEINQKELDYLKKYNRKRKKAILIGILLGIFIILACYLGTALHRFYIMHILDLQFQDYNQKNNIYVEVMEADLKSNIYNVITTRYWYKDGILRFESDINDKKASTTHIIDFNKQIAYRINLNNKEKQETLPSMPKDILDTLIGRCYFDNLYTKFRLSFDFTSAHIYQNKQLFGNEYYIYDCGSEVYIYDKESKLLKCILQYLGDRVHLQIYKYEFESVKEEDISLLNF